MEEVSNRSPREYLRIVFFFFVIIAAAIFLFTMPRLAVPFGVAYFLYLVLHPVIPFLIKFGLSKNSAVMILFISITVLTIVPIVKLAPIVIDESDNLQYYIPKVETYTWDVYHKLTTLIDEKVGYKFNDKYLTDLLTYAKGITKSVLINVPTILASILEWFFIIPILLFFMLKDGFAFKKSLLQLTPNSFFERFYFLFYQLNKKFGDYLFAKFIEALIVGGIITITLLILGVRFSLILGLIAGLTNIIPYVGPLIGAVPGIVLAFVEYGPGPITFGVLILYLVANFIDLALVFPLLVSKIVDMHPIVVIVSVILGSQLFGVVGMIISIPAAAAIKLLFTEIYHSIYKVQR